MNSLCKCICMMYIKICVINIRTRSREDIRTKYSSYVQSTSFLVCAVYICKKEFYESTLYSYEYFRIFLKCVFIYINVVSIIYMIYMSTFVLNYILRSIICVHQNIFYCNSMLFKFTGETFFCPSSPSSPSSSSLFSSSHLQLLQQYFPKH